MLNFVVLGIALIYIGYLTVPCCQLQSNKIQKIIIGLLFLIHFFSVGLAYKFTIDNPYNDASSFYLNAQKGDSWFSVFGLGSSLMVFLIYPLVKAGLSLFTLFVVFGAISYHGFILYFQKLNGLETKSLSFFGVNLFKWLFLLPGLHFWSGFLSKDALVFFLLAILLPNKNEDFKFNYPKILALLSLVLIRPHLFFVVMLVIFLIFILNKEISKKKKIIINGSILLVLFLCLPFLKKILKLKSYSIQSIKDNFLFLTHFAKEGGSGVDLNDLNYIERIWVLLFRPLFYDAKNLYQIADSIENIIILISLILFVIFYFTKKTTFKITKDAKFALFIGIAILLFISIYIYNLGLASRMRLMFWPYIFYGLYQICCSSRTIEKDS